MKLEYRKVWTRLISRRNTAIVGDLPYGCGNGTGRASTNLGTRSIVWTFPFSMVGLFPTSPLHFQRRRSYYLSFYIPLGDDT